MMTDLYLSSDLVQQIMRMLFAIIRIVLQRLQMKLRIRYWSFHVYILTSQELLVMVTKECSISLDPTKASDMLEGLYAIRKCI